MYVESIMTRQHIFQISVEGDLKKKNLCIQNSTKEWKNLMKLRGNGEEMGDKVGAPYVVCNQPFVLLGYLVCSV